MPNRIAGIQYRETKTKITAQLTGVESAVVTRAINKAEILVVSEEEFRQLSERAEQLKQQCGELKEEYWEALRETVDYYFPSVEDRAKTRELQTRQWVFKVGKEENTIATSRKTDWELAFNTLAATVGASLTAQENAIDAATTVENKPKKTKLYMPERIAEKQQLARGAR
jgi:hypothetical protein